MGGVNQLDQNTAQYWTGIRSRRWYWPIIVYLLQTAMHNAWILSCDSDAAATLPLYSIFVKCVNYTMLSIKQVLWCLSVP